MMRDIWVSLYIPALGPTRSPIQYVWEVIFLGVKRSERYADHSLTSGPGAEVQWNHYFYLISTHGSTYPIV
jgi:hypothetical protein